jgi:hypothetical protein
MIPLQVCLHLHHQGIQSFGKVSMVPYVLQQGIACPKKPLKVKNVTYRSQHGTLLIGVKLCTLLESMMKLYIWTSKSSEMLVLIGSSIWSTSFNITRQTLTGNSFEKPLFDNESVNKQNETESNNEQRIYIINIYVCGTLARHYPSITTMFRYQMVYCVHCLDSNLSILNHPQSSQNLRLGIETMDH